MAPEDIVPEVAVPADIASEVLPVREAAEALGAVLAVLEEDTA